jgi:transposase
MCRLGSGCGSGASNARDGMIVAGQRLPIRIATRSVDFRCGHQALALMVQTELKLDPHFG